MFDHVFSSYCREHEITQEKEDLEKINQINTGHQAKVNGFNAQIQLQLLIHLRSLSN